MKTALILHGKPSKEGYFNPESPGQSNMHWLPWLQQQLILKGVLAQTPEWPEPYDADYEKWLALFQQFKIDADTMLIGHSCGAGFLVRWLSENDVHVGKVALVGPFLDPYHNEVKPSFFDFTIDPNLVSKTAGVRIFYSTDDEPSIPLSAKQIQEAASGVEVKQFTDKGHFTFRSMHTNQFPELLHWLTQL